MEITQEVLDTFYPNHQKGKLLQTCFDGFNIHKDDPLKENYLFIENIFLMAKENIIYDNALETLKIMNIFQKIFNDIENKLVLNPLYILKSVIARLIYSNKKSLGNNSFDISKNNFIIRNFLVFLIEIYDNLEEQEVLEFLKIIK